MTNAELTRVAEPAALRGNGEAEGRSFPGKRLEREWRTIAAMIGLYCRDHHAGGSALCPECQGLRDYAEARLERCRFGAEKPVCAKCPVHCYQPARREQVRAVMRYAGPRMVWRHPVLSLRHWVDGWRGAPGAGTD
jgi:hypothetical protein